MEINESLSGNSKISQNKGYITRIKLYNFVTYDEVVIVPGPNLNLITGANGSGKSTIVCGILLGLGGKVANLNRGTHLSDFIKNGKEESYIEIDLCNSPTESQSSVTIKRAFKHNTNENNSMWYMNSKKVSRKDVEELMKSFNIQVDNLCQFLPQDRVAEFAKMNQRDLLKNTERAINIKLLEQHEQLSNMHTTENRLKNELEILENKLETAKKEANDWKEQYNKMQQRKQLSKELEALKCRKIELKIEEIKDQYDEAKNAYKKATEHLKIIQNQIPPLEKKINDANKNLKKIEEDVYVFQNKFDAKIQADKIFKKKIEDSAYEINNAKDSFNRTVLEQQELDGKRQTLQDQIERILAEYNEVQTDIEEAQSEMSNVNRGLKDVNKEITSIQDQLSDFERQKRQFSGQLNTAEREQARLDNVGNQRMELIRRVNKDVYDAIQWLEKNRQMFNGQVFLPPLLLIECQNADLAKYVEASIPLRDLLAFMFEDSNDMNTFLKITRDEKKWKINCVQTPRQSSNEFQPSVSINYLKPYGFSMFVHESFNCPDAMKAYLCKNHFLHNIPIGNNRTQDRLQDVMENVINDSSLKIKCFFTDIYNYKINRSHYTGEIINISSDIRPSQYFVNTNNQSRLNELREHIENLKEQYQQAEESIESKMQEKKEKDKIRETFLKKTNNMSKLKERSGHLNSRLTLFKKQLDSLETISIEDAQNSYERIVSNCTNKKIKLFQEMTKSIVDYVPLAKKLLAMMTSKISLKESVDKWKIEVTDLNNEKQQATDESLRLKEKAKEHLENFKKLTNTFNSKMEAIGVTIDDLSNLSDDIDEIDSKIFEFEARLELTSKQVEDVEKKYEQAVKTLEKINKDYDNNKEKLSSYIEGGETLRTSWEQEICKNINSISIDFATFMKYLKCAGEVVLFKPENHLDYENYGISIRVKFRDCESLNELNANRQSGGERAVSTILYLLSLQRFTSAPFRVVDEINQGMDATNERKVYELLIKHISLSDSCSQYFMLSPKLLPNLDYPKNCKFHCTTKFCIPKYGLSYDRLENKTFFENARRLSGV